MCVYVRLEAHLCVHACMRVSAIVYMWMSVLLLLGACACVLSYRLPVCNSLPPTHAVDAHTYTNTHMHMHTNIPTHAHIHTHTHAHTYTHKHTHVYTHTVPNWTASITFISRKTWESPSRRGSPSTPRTLKRRSSSPWRCWRTPTPSQS